MAIDQKIMYVQKSHRLSMYNVSPNVTDVHEGQRFHLDDQGEWDYADGTRKSYPVMNNRFAGAGFGPQGERLEGRDDVSRAGKLSALVGGYEIATDQFDADVSYTHGAALVDSSDPEKAGQVTLFVEATHKPHLIVGYVTQVPQETGDYLRYQG